MSVDPDSPRNPIFERRERLLAAFLSEIERLGDSAVDGTTERNDPGRTVETGWQLTPEDIANAVPARPLFEEAIRRLERE